MSIIEQLVRIVAPFHCIGCGVEEDTLLCTACTQNLLPAAPACYRCGRASRNYTVCPDCRSQTELDRVVAACHYHGLAQQLVHHVKYERAQAGVSELAHSITEAAAPFPADALLVYVPTATSRVRARGYDHAALLARMVSRMTGLPYKRLLTRMGQAHQVGAGRSQRKRQLASAFRAVNVERIYGRHIILIDDVVTTGATLEAAARELRAHGAARIEAVVFARA